MRTDTESFTMKSKWFIDLKLTIIFSGIIAIIFAPIAFIIVLISKQKPIEALYTFIGVFFASFIASSILCTRDNRQRKKHIKNRPVEECIKDIEKIREHSDTAIGMLESGRERLQNNYPDDETKWVWIEQAIEFTQRFAALAASEDTTPEQAEALEDEVKPFVKQNKLKYPFICGENLADLIRERNSKIKKDNETF
ncbi:MAG: hypothetical protein JXA96_17635 [Sedimentisphaerales bacterium]|nr:hypothetical protein [Sedimentisphaerales bacterium]